MANRADQSPSTVLDGSYASAVIDRHPDVRAAVFERTPVDHAARTLLRERGGYDAGLYSHVLHDWEADRVEYLLVASFAALPAGGWLIDHDAHINADKRGPLYVAEYSVLLMHSTPGKCWSVGELAEIAGRVGFVDISHKPTVADRGIFLARKPGHRTSSIDTPRGNLPSSTHASPSYTRPGIARG